MTKITVILPDGTTGKRETKRPYECVVAVGPRRRQHAIDQWNRTIAHEIDLVTEYEATIERLKSVEIIRTEESIYHTWAYRITDIKLAKSGYERANMVRTLSSSADDAEAARAEDIAWYESFVAGCRERAERFKAKRAEVEAGPEFIGTWGVMSWHHRYDLAVSALNGYDKAYGEYQIIKLGEAA
jgi:hypothetical protein